MAVLDLDVIAAVVDHVELLCMSIVKAEVAPVRKEECYRANHLVVDKAADAGLFDVLQIEYRADWCHQQDVNGIIDKELVELDFAFFALHHAIDRILLLLLEHRVGYAQHRFVLEEGSSIDLDHHVPIHK